MMTSRVMSGVGTQRFGDLGAVLDEGVGDDADGVQGPREPRVLHRVDHRLENLGRGAADVERAPRVDLTFPAASASVWRFVGAFLPAI